MVCLICCSRRGHSMWLQPPADDSSTQHAGWLFGGWTEGGARLNDLWRLDPSDGCGGSTVGDEDRLPRWDCGRIWQPVEHGHRTPATVTDTAGEYGESGQQAETNVPGARDGQAVVLHRQAGGDRLWMFGGAGLVRAGEAVTQTTVVLSASGQDGDANEQSFSFTACEPSATISIRVSGTSHRHRSLSWGTTVRFLSPVPEAALPALGHQHRLRFELGVHRCLSQRPFRRHLLARRCSGQPLQFGDGPVHVGSTHRGLHHREIVSGR